MSPNEQDPAEIIADALSRLRGRRQGGRGHGGGHADRFGPHAQGDPHAHAHGHGGPHGEHGHHGFGVPPWAGGTSGRIGGPAWIRMLDALAVASDPLSVGALGEAIGVDQPRASRLVQQGVERGFVRREADPDDARRTRIALTEDGRRVAKGMRGQRREQLGQALVEFTDIERAELARLLSKLADNWPG